MNHYARDSLAPIAAPAVQIDTRVVHFAAHRIIGPEGETRVTPKAMQVLQLLAAQPFEPVSREVLLDRVWGERYPTDEVITHVINELRRAFGDSARQPHVIQTVPRVGYRLIQAVVPLEHTPLPVVPSDDVPNLATVPENAGAVTSGAGRRHSAWALATGGILVLLGLGAWLAVPARTPSTSVLELRPLTADKGREQFPTISPDGRHVAYIAVQTQPRSLTAQLVVRAVGSDRSKILLVSGADGEHVRAPAWSPDSREVAVMLVAGADCRVVAIAVDSSVRRVLGACRSEDGGRARMAWSPDGTQIALAQPIDDARAHTRIHLLDVASGAIRLLATPIVPESDAIDPRFSPDGAQLAWRELRQAGSQLHDEIVIAPRQGGAVRSVFRSDRPLHGFDWRADGRSLVVSVVGAQGPRLHALDLDDGAKREIDLAQTAAFPSLARGEATLVFSTFAAPRPTNIVIQSLEWPVPAIKQEYFGATRRSAAPRFSADGARIAFVSDRNGSWQIWQGAVHAADDAQALTHWQPSVRPLEHLWRADGAAVFIAYAQDGQTRIAEYALDGGPPRLLYRATQEVSAFAYDEQHGALYVAPAAPGDTRLLRIGADGTREILPVDNLQGFAFDRDGALLFARVGDNGLWRASPSDWNAQRLPGVARCNEFTSWALHAEGVVYWAYIEGGEALMLAPRDDWAHSRVFAGLIGPYANRDFVLSPDGQRVALVADSEPEADIMLARLN